MRKEISLTLLPKQASDYNEIKKATAQKLNINATNINGLKILKKSIDARKNPIFINLQILAVTHEKNFINKEFFPKFDYQDVRNKPEIIIVGAGPAGYFAALQLIEKGLKPVIFERGKTIRERRHDIAHLHKKHEINPESNYCFGEGGAGTFSDGKLNTRSKKRGNVQRTLERLYFHGASEEILYDSQPHIGTDKLAPIIKNMREIIINAGGEIYFNKKIIDLIIKNDAIEGVVSENGDKRYSKNVILATGHSARDIYEMLQNKSIEIEAKSFAIGVRVEHPQYLIDTIQYHGKKNANNLYLPAASYKLTTQVKGRGVYSFCMCPGGYIVPTPTETNGLVVNGMSASYRNSEFANAAFVTEVKPEDLKEYEKYGALAGVKFQQKVEQMAMLNGGGRDITAPAQALADFVKGRISQELPYYSYFPGIVSSPVHFWLPEFVSNSLREGLKNIGKRINGFITNEALVVGVETRTSAPVRIPRHKDTLQHIKIKGLYPCGEGAGYAGGIVSSAMDGENCAEKIAQDY